MPDIAIRLFLPTETHLYRQLRLRALADAPYAFGTTLAEAQTRSDSEWQNRFSQSLASDLELPLLGLVDAHPAGLAWGHIDPAIPFVAHLFQMWVEPHYRRLQLGKQMVDAVVHWAETHAVTYVELDVSVGNSAAQSLYQRCGFLKWGDPHPLRPGMTLMSQTMRYPFSK